MHVLGTMRSTESNMAFAWQLIFNVEILLLLFFRSQREANFQLHTEVWRFFMKYYFALDCYNYTRWLSVYLFDCKALKFTAPGIFIAFMDGCFLFQKMSTEFWRIPLDQVHEQNNTYIRGVAGETHLVNHTDEAGLIRWELCSNELAMMIQEFENNYRKHHEDTSFQKRFLEDAAKLYSNFTRNPFELSDLTRIDDTSLRFDPRTLADTKLLKSNGEQQFNVLG